MEAGGGVSGGRRRRRGGEMEVDRSVRRQKPRNENSGVPELGKVGRAEM